MLYKARGKSRNASTKPFGLLEPFSKGGGNVGDCRWRSSKPPEDPEWPDGHGWK